MTTESHLLGGLARDTLTQLQLLAESSRHLQELQSRTLATQQGVDDLRVELRRLERKRNELQVALEVLPSKKVVDVVRDGRHRVTGPEGMACDEIPQAMRDEIEKDAKENTKKRRRSETYIAYRLAGKTIFPMSAGRLGIRFETFFNRKYFECYYVILRFDADTEDLSVFKHTLPHFVSIGSLTRQLNKNFQMFMETISDKLHAFVARREQCLLLSDNDKVANVSGSEAYDFVRFNVELPQCPAMEVNLVYDDLLKSLPTRVAVKMSQSGRTLAGQSAESVTKVFRTTPLHEAWTLLSDLDELSSYETA